LKSDENWLPLLFCLKAGINELLKYRPMSVHATVRKVTTHVLNEMKLRGEKIAMLTAYDYTFAKILDRAGIDIILVGDSASNVMAGNETTLPITLNEMIYHAAGVVKAVKRSLVVVDLPLPGKFTGSPAIFHPYYERDRCGCCKAGRWK
jgi:hypothetical protein